MENIQRCTEEHCLTCSDALLVVRVKELRKEEDLALIEVDGQVEEVDISLIEEVRPGDILLAHGGVALARQTENAATSTVEPAR